MANYSDIFIDQGSTFSSVIDVGDGAGLPIDLTGYSARGHIKRSYSATEPDAEFTTEIVIPSSGQVIISLTAAETAALKPRRYLFDVEIYNNAGIVTRIAEGQIHISPSVTKPV